MYTNYNPSLQPPCYLLHAFKFPSSHLLHLDSNGQFELFLQDLIKLLCSCLQTNYQATSNQNYGFSLLLKDL